MSPSASSNPANPSIQPYTGLDGSNSIYRGEHSRLGWTTEADLLDGVRTDEAEVNGLIAHHDSIILLCQDGAEIIGSVLVEKAEGHANLGMFVVEPSRQAGGIGKQLLARAENLVQKEWRLGRIVMHVISQRRELIEFYGRRGYRPTGVLQEFPINSGLWQPKVPGLVFEILEKTL